MKIKFTTVKNITANSGKNYKKCGAIDFQGTFSVWPDNPEYDKIIPNYETDGELVKNDKGYWTLYAPKTTKTPYKTNYQAKTDQSVAKAQERKEDSIILSSTFRDATSITVALLGNAKIELTPENFKTTWLKWREWLIANWDATDGMDKTKTSDGSDMPTF